MDNHHISFSRRVLSYLISVLIAGQPVLPAIGAVVTPSGNTKMDQAGNGVPVVNIATPNGAGISHNRYGEYNVGKEGLILNNATGKLNQTQLGGLIQNNPNLKAGQEARGIINEVTGGKRSELKGYTEVAGKAANVMVANPYGITCDGCGFINTPQATLTTGKPVMNADGSLQALEVTKGSITINGAGLDGSQSDAVSIIARATEVNAALHAKDLTVTTGANRVGEDGRITAIKGDGAAPVVAIDTGALGGMYANRIRLTSTESGVGVNLGNLNARQGDITLNSAGKLVLKDSLASGNTTVSGTEVKLSGDNKAGGSLNVTGTTALTLNQSRLVADKNLALSSSGQIVQNGGELTVGQNATLSGQSLGQNSSGRISAAGNITLTTSGDATLKGNTVAGKTLTVSTGSLNNGGTLAAGTDATVNTGTFSNTGTVQGNSLKVTATDLTSSGSLKSNTTLDINARNATLSGDTDAKGRTSVTASGKLDNRGRLISDDTLTLSAARISNSGTLSGARGLTASADTLTTTEKSVTHSDGNLTLNSASVTLAGETSSGGAVTVKGNSLKTTTTAQTQGNSVSVDVQNAQLDGTQAARDGLTLKARDTLTHGGKSSASVLNTESSSFSNSGTLTASVLAINSPTVINNGLIHGKRTLSLVSRLLDNRDSGVVYSPAALSLSLSELKNTGIITSDAALSLSGTQLTNSGELSGAALSVDYGTLSNNAGGLLLAQGASRITSQSVSNSGTIAGNTLTLNTDRLTGSGLLQGDTALSLTAGILDLLAGSRTLTGADLTLSGTTLTTAGQMFTNNGTLTTGTGSSTFSALDILLNTSGSLSGGGDISVVSRGDVTVNGFTGTAGSLNVSAAGKLLNTALIYAGNNLKLFADRIHNTYGDILAGNSLWMQKNASGTANTEIINTSGNIETLRGDITMKTGHLLNQRDGFSATTTTISNPSAINGMGGATIEVPLSLMPDGSYGYFTREVENQHGTPCNGHGACNITIDTVYYYAPFAEHATQRFLSSQRVTTVTGGGNPAGRITSGRDLSVQAGLLENQASFILANGDIALSGNQLSNQSWQTGTENVYLVYRYDPRSTYWSGGYATGSLDELGPRLPEFKNDTLIFTLDGQATDYTQGETYYSVIRAGGNVGINFTSSVNNGTTSAHAGSVSNTITAPALNTLSQQNISGGLTQTTLQDAGAVAVGSPQWRDEVSGALQVISGGSSLSGQNGSSGSYPLPSGNNGYFVPSTDPDSPYLITVNPKLDGLGNLDSSLFDGLYGLLGMKPGQVPRETDTRWTDEKQFLGSSYFLDRLNLKPEKDYRFLGDAAFDTRYVSNALLNQTGSRYINGTGSDLEQMQYLMDSAASQQKGLGLQFGVALTAEQVARLTGSILWLESATINGQTVMVPKLYLSPQDVTINNGSVISGNNVQLAGGNITNSGGTLTAQNTLTLNSANSIDNLNAGLINAGGSLNLSAIGDINNIGSAISGKTVALESISGSINNVTRTQQWSAGSDGRYGSVHVSGTDTGPVATIKATESLSLDADRNINITGANVTSGGTLGMSAGNDISITANQISESKSQSGFWRTKDNSSSSTASQGSTVSAGGNLVMVADNNLNVTASNISAQDSALLSAGNDLNLNAARESNNTRNGKSESHESHAAVSTVTAGNNLTLAAGRDITSQAAGIAAENDVAIQAGRDVNLMAESASAGNSYISKNKKEINESVRQQGTDITSGGNTTIVAGRDVTAQAADVYATGNTAVVAGRDITLTTATESDYEYREKKKTSGGMFSKKTTHTIHEESHTREKGTQLSGENVVLSAGNNLTAQGSSVAAERDVALKAGNNVTVEAATNTDTYYDMKKTKKSGIFSSGSGPGVTIGSQSSKTTRQGAETTQSDARSMVGTSGGNVIISAGNQVTLSAADVIAGRAKDDTSRATGHIDITGSDIAIIPGRDTVTESVKQETKSSGITVSVKAPFEDTVRNVRDIVRGKDGNGNSTVDKVKSLGAEGAALALDGPGQMVAVSAGSSKSSSESHY